MAKITLSNLAHSYQAKPKTPADFALQTLDHEWQDGTAYALLGPSGCGKSTLLNIISGLVKPSQGRVLFDGVDMTHAATAQRNIAQVFQFPVVYDTMTVAENLAFPLKNRKMDSIYIGKRVQQVAQMIGLESLLAKKAQGLSADVQQKISLGRGIVREQVNAILFDEPLTVIDPQMKWALRTQLKELHRQLSHTMIYVTHDQTEALTFADQVVVMHQGQVLQIGSPQQLFERPQHTFVGYFIGSPGMNVIPATIFANSASIGDYTLCLNKHYPALSGVTAIGVRPEHLILSNDSSGLQVELLRVEDVGHYQIVRTRHQDTAIDVRVGKSFEHSMENCYLSFDQNFCHVYSDDWLVQGR
jgi:glycerol transport system ATP-binding protein